MPLPAQTLFGRISIRLPPFALRAFGLPLNKFERKPAGWSVAARNLVGLAEGCKNYPKRFFVMHRFI